MKNFEHYKRGYYMPPVASTNWVNKEYVDKAPAWCSVDLRDGNQALIVPMSLEEKLDDWNNTYRNTTLFFLLLESPRNIFIIVPVPLTYFSFQPTAIKPHFIRLLEWNPCFMSHTRLAVH